MCKIAFNVTLQESTSHSLLYLLLPMTYIVLSPGDVDKSDVLSNDIL